MLNVDNKFYNKNNGLMVEMIKNLIINFLLVVARYQLIIFMLFLVRVEI